MALKKKKKLVRVVELEWIERGSQKKWVGVPKKLETSGVHGRWRENVIRSG